MTKNNKGRSGGDRATLKAFDSFNHTQIASLSGGVAPWRREVGNSALMASMTIGLARAVKRRIRRMLAKQEGRK